MCVQQHTLLVLGSNISFYLLLLVTTSLTGVAPSKLNPHTPQMMDQGVRVRGCVCASVCLLGCTKAHHRAGPFSWRGGAEFKGQTHMWRVSKQPGKRNRNLIRTETHRSVTLSHPLSVCVHVCVCYSVCAKGFKDVKLKNSPFSSLYLNSHMVSQVNHFALYWLYFTKLITINFTTFSRNLRQTNKTQRPDWKAVSTEQTEPWKAKAQSYNLVDE